MGGTLMPRCASKSQRVALFILEDGKCAICGEDLPPEQFDADHITPWINEGKTELWNLQPLCLKCHLKKSRAQASRRSSTR
jgi:5-methylcytosine-specific restriction endonuclease McrA